MDHIKPSALYFVCNLRENAKSYEFYSVPTFSKLTLESNLQRKETLLDNEQHMGT